MHDPTSIYRMALALALCGAGWAFAQDAPAPPSGLGVPLQAEQLDSYRGGFDLVTNNAQLSGTVADNAAANVFTGNNSIADGSFANASGLPMVIQNSGANVLIQNATVVNVQLQ